MTDEIKSYLTSNPYAMDADDGCINDRIALGKETNSHENKAIVPFPPIPEGKTLTDILYYAEVRRLQKHYHTNVRMTHYLYRSNEGEIIQAVIRIDNADGSKHILPLRFLGKAGWWFTAIESPRPLYGLEKLAARADARVLIVEGEKTADAAQALFLDDIVMTWPSGAHNTARTEWLPLHGRKVVIWPDNDDAGQKAARKVAAHALRAGAESARIVDVPSQLPLKWDLADEIPPELADSISIHTLVDQAKLVTLADVEDTISERNTAEDAPRVLGHKAGYSKVDIEEVARALKHFDAGVPRSKWLTIGRCLFFAFEARGLPLFDEWSRTAPKSYKEGEPAELWSMWKDDPHVKALPLIWLLVKAGQAARESNSNYVVDPDAIAAAEIEAINESHAVVTRGGKTLVMRERFDPTSNQYEIDYLTKESFIAMHVRRILVAEDDEQQGSKPKPRFPLGSFWFHSGRRRQYQNVYFAPGAQVSRGDLNLWQGFVVEAVDNPGGWSMFRDHIRDNIAGGHEPSFEYILNWMAFAVQVLNKRVGTALVLLGPKGVGKSIFAQLFGFLFGRHKFVTAQSGDVVGNFNDRLESTLLLALDEAFVSQNLEAESVLKDLITRETLRLEAKFLSIWDSPNYLRIVLTSNYEHVVRADVTERRYAVFNVTHPLERDPIARNAHFGAMIRQMENGGYSAMLYELQRRDITTWIAEAIPETPALANQKKLQALEEPVTGWYHDRLVDGIHITVTSPQAAETYRWSNEDTVWVPISVLKQDHEAYCKAHRVRYSAHALSTKLKTLMPDGFGSKNKRMPASALDYTPPGGTAAKSESVKAQPFPALAEARAFFTEKTHIPIAPDEQAD